MTIVGYILRVAKDDDYTIDFVFLSKSDEMYSMLFAYFNIISNKKCIYLQHRRKKFVAWKSSKQTS